MRSRLLSLVSRYLLIILIYSGVSHNLPHSTDRTDTDEAENGFLIEDNRGKQAQIYHFGRAAAGYNITGRDAGL